MTGNPVVHGSHRRKGLLLVALTLAPAAGAATRVRNGSAESPIQPVQSPLDVVSFYAYDTLFAASASTGLETFDTSLLFLYQQTGGPLSLVVIHDRPNGVRPLRDATFRIRNLPIGTTYAVKDDPGGDSYTSIAGGSTIADWRWGPCCTDGLALTDLGTAPFCLGVDPIFFDPGITAWQAVLGPNLPGSRFTLPNRGATSYLCRDCQTLTCPALVAAECTGSHAAFVEVLAMGFSLCGGAGITNDRTNGGAIASDVYPLGTSDVRFTLHDTAGFQMTCDSLIVVEDTLAPLVTRCPAPLVLPCTTGSIPVADPRVQAWLAEFEASDACGSVTLANNAPALFEVTCPVVPVLVTFVATDETGRTASCAATVSVGDATPPVLQNVPADLTISCETPPPPPAIVTAVDDCDPAPVVTFAETTTSGPCAETYTITRTWTASDVCANVAAGVQIIAVADVTPPVLQDVPVDVTVACDAVPPPPANVTATDLCDVAPVVTLVETRTDGPCPQTYTLTRTFTAMDACLNSISLSQTVTVVDVAPPVLAGVPPSTTVACDAVPPPAAGVTATDTCDPSPVVTFMEARTDGTCEDRYTLTRTWTALDACGNATAEAETVTVADPTPPALQGVPPDETVACSAVPPVATGITATDNCDPAPLVTFLETRTDGACADGYTLTRAWTATDRCGNAVSASQVLTVRDTTAPVLANVPPPITAECSAVPPPSTGVTATDDCDPAPVITLAETRTDGPCAGSSTLTRTWTATDRCGNASALWQTVTLVDTTPPVLQGVPADATVPCHAVPPPAAVNAIDACDPAPVVTLVENRTDGPCADSYTLARTWTATDACGNAVAATATLTVVDTEPPVLGNVPADATVSCDTVPAPASVTAADRCDPAPVVTFVETRTDGPCPDSYTLSRRFTATDRCGNASSVTQTLVVLDTTPPVLWSVPGDATVECDEVPPPAMVSASDNCDPAPVLTFAETRADGPCADSYTLTRTWTATDRCGNLASHTVTLVVLDTIPPVIANVPGDATVECDEVPPAAGVTASDNCDPDPVLTFAETRTDGSCADSYTLTRIWTAIDRCANLATATTLVVVRDTTPPVPLAALAPAPPASPGVPRAPSSVCSAPSSGRFELRCSSLDNCDPSPLTTAVLRVVNHDVPAPGACIERVDLVPIACGATFEVRLVRAPCPSRGPRSPRPAETAGSDGVLIVTGDSVTVEVTGTDRCGNAATLSIDPTAPPPAPPPPCGDPLPDGSCCPFLAPPPKEDCRVPVCGSP